MKSGRGKLTFDERVVGKLTFDAGRARVLHSVEFEGFDRSKFRA